MKVDSKGIDFIHSFEGLRLKPYLCQAGVPTIGWGNTVYPNGKKVTLKDPPITKEYADEMFAHTLGLFERDVTTLLKGVSVTQNQFNALVSFAYNVGTDIDADDIPEGLGDSTLLKKVLKDPNDATISIEFAKWVKANGKPSEGLKNRRLAEIKMYYTK